MEFVVSKSTWCLASTETIRFIRDGEKGREGRGCGGGGKGRLYTYRYTVTTRMTCIKVGSDESHLNFHNCEGQSHKTVSMYRPQLLKKKESLSGFEPRSLCLPA